MTNKMLDRIEQSPVLSGGVTVFGVALALVALFVLGVLGGNLWNRTAEKAEFTSVSEPPSASTQATNAGNATSADPAQQGDSGGVNAANGANAAAPDLANDLAAATGEPSVADSAPAYRPDWLSKNFGDAVAPMSLAGLKRASIVVDDTRVTADYTGGDAGAVESARLEVSNSADGGKLAARIDAALGEFTDGLIEYQRGGRLVTQGVTNESRLDLFPPSVRFVWASGDYVVRFTIIPMEPGRVFEARAAGLEFIDGLKY